MIQSRTGRTVLALFTMTVLAGVTAPQPPGRAQGRQQFPEADLFLELNDTDGDLGIHASIDGGPWTELLIEGPDDRRLLDIVSREQLRQQGLTQLFFESAEPSFDELAPAAFLKRFPEGRYEIKGRLQDGGTIQSTAVLSHVLAAPPENILISGVAAAEDCEAAALPTVSAPVWISWDPVTGSHPEIGRRGPVQIDRYQLFVEGKAVKLSLDLSPGVTAFEIPAGFADAEREFKLEIIARTTAGNNTAVETCFRVR
jgi:hypothetical protein